MKVSTVSEMRAMDRAAAEKYGIPEMILMENAGLAAYELLIGLCDIPGRTFIVMAGIGNNAGDGFVVARKIHSAGGKVAVFILGDMNSFKGPARTNLEAIRKLPIKLAEVSSSEIMKKDLAHCDVIIDAIFGTGLTREVEGLHRDAVSMMNASGKTIISLDIPSGINGDTGRVMGCAVKADHTITFGLPKPGNILLPGALHCGELSVTHISFAPDLYASESLMISLNEPLPLPQRDPDGHKGDFGEALFIAGARGYYGAPLFSALSFLKAGGGYSRLATPESVMPFIASSGPEIVFLPQKETEAGSLSLKNNTDLLKISDRMDLVVIGPGLSLNEETCALVRELTVRIRKPLLIDGDGITAVCHDPGCIRKRKAPTILTPHFGEMSRLTGKPVQAIEEEKIGILKKTSSDLNAIIVLKGARSIIGYPDGRLYVNMSGNSGMATAGSGDVLTGTIAAMHGLGLSVDDAVRNGVFIHGASGDLAAKKSGEDGITARDILDRLPDTLAMHRDGDLEELYSLPVIL